MFKLVDANCVGWLRWVLCLKMHSSPPSQPLSDRFDVFCLSDDSHADPLHLCVSYDDHLPPQLAQLPELPQLPQPNQTVATSLPNALGSRHSRSPPIDIPGNESPSDRFRPIGRFEEDLVLHLSKRVQALERELVLLKAHLKTTHAWSGHLSRSCPF